MDAPLPPIAFQGILALDVAVTARVTEKDIRVAEWIQRMS